MKIDIIKWINAQRALVDVRVERILFKDLTKWRVSDSKSCIEHDTGGFFSIQGIKIKTNLGNRTEWYQPVINQSEIGYLGFIVKKFQKDYKFLVQAKIEPGNINFVQLSPTIQATKSNFTQLHGGRKPDYLEYFTDSDKIVMIDQLQSEQNERFLKKRNRNIIIETESEVFVKENFIWLTLAELKEAIKLDNVVNMDSRTVLSNLNDSLLKMFYGNSYNEDNIFAKSLLSEEYAQYSFTLLKSWLTELKFKYNLKIEKQKLTELKDWIFTDREISSENQKFKVIAADITISNREVAHWTQPLMEATEDGLFIFITAKIKGIMHFLVQAKLEAGCFDTFELAPTIQCYSGEKDVPYMKVLKTKEYKMIHESWQSEEGGRFFREQNKNMIIEIENYKTCEPILENYRWMTLSQIYKFIEFNNLVNIQARSILSTIDYR